MDDGERGWDYTTRVCVCGWLDAFYIYLFFLCELPDATSGGSTRVFCLAREGVKCRVDVRDKTCKDVRQAKLRFYIICLIICCITFCPIIERCDSAWGILIIYIYIYIYIWIFKLIIIFQLL